MTIFRRIFGLNRSANKLKTTDWLFIAAGLAVFLIITLWTITKSSIWFDEAFGAYLIRFNFWDIAIYTAADVHPPLYYWLLKLWSICFGNTELALRSMSVLFGGVSIVFGYLLTHRLFNKKAARISLIFMVLAPMFVRYSQEMRMYTLVTAIALAATYVLTYAINTKKKMPWIIYGVLVGLGMWAHYFSAIVWIAHWVWRADAVRRIAKKGKFIKTLFSKQWIMAHVIAIGLFIPWLPFFAKQMFTVQAFGFWIPSVTPDTLVNFMSNVVYYQDSGNITGWLATVFLVVFIAVIVLAIRVYKNQNETERQAYRLIMTVAFVPVLILFFASMPPLRSSFVDRYLVPSALAISLFLGVTLAFSMKLIKSKLSIVVIAIVAGMMMVGVSNVWHLGNYSKTSNASNNTRQIFEAIVAKSGENQPIIADSPWLYYEAVFYSTDKHSVYFIDANTQYLYGSLDMLKYNDYHKIKDINVFTSENQIVWYVGLPRGADFKTPYPNWKPIQEVAVNDSINGKPAYKAIQYSVQN
ncbi:hypothetical protein COV88_02605 [Candidatus Saccharibacteria bacterium CG11_big_fil_rev_8_21_14_0_20_41_19]|nr:hypothetical protein [Candidatus Saccharibacteria bacterium]OIP86026.1 MAG: hypothetical protein AUK57_01790 [Candidatus Saccharibacteria bacterium CG2_30_41_52]PIQ70784.1 MAG: hypothetical protein COV88_02605 [Candidatus Saccharibacteria bacterium CG11_big_fil_rev_8_21_14_0_20_41_19]PIZ59692.1 MAG: hypothetical protein COY18_02770 [Candidatus Saccharibacteria bacterium CG_4_10_14_0_2_um_filter_41_11]PJE66274.1 MAG: hypothetical protein COU92_01240 [Candidatus Saccharibacteria bacterium CG10